MNKVAYSTRDAIDWYTTMDWLKEILPFQVTEKHYLDIVKNNVNRNGFVLVDYDCKTVRFLSVDDDIVADDMRDFEIIHNTEAADTYFWQKQQEKTLRDPVIFPITKQYLDGMELLQSIDTPIAKLMVDLYTLIYLSTSKGPEMEMPVIEIDGKLDIRLAYDLTDFPFVLSVYDVDTATYQAKGRFRYFKKFTKDMIDKNYLMKIHYAARTGKTIVDQKYQSDTLLDYNWDPKPWQEILK